MSSTSLETAQAVASVARNRYFRSFVNTDVIGTEFGGVLKNLIAVAIGIVDGRTARRAARRAGTGRALGSDAARPEGDGAP